MPPLQFPFTTGLPPAAVDALQKLFAQLSRRKEQEAQAKAETERIKAQTQRGLGSAAINIATGGIAGGITGGVGGAFAGALGVDPNLFTKRQLNERDIRDFGIGTEPLNAQADALYGRLQEGRTAGSDVLNPTFGLSGLPGFGQSNRFPSIGGGRQTPFLGELAPPQPAQLGPQQLGPQQPLPSKKEFRTMFRQGLLQRKQQLQADNKRRGELEQQKKRQFQKAAAEQQIQAWLPDPNLQYDPEIPKEMALLRPRLRETILYPERVKDSEGRPMSPLEVQNERKFIQESLVKLRQMGTAKPKFDKNKFGETQLLDLPDGGRIMFDPTNNNKPTHIRAPSKSKDGNSILSEFEEEALDAAEKELTGGTDEDIIESARSRVRRRKQFIDDKRASNILGANPKRSSLQSAAPIDPQQQALLKQFASSISGGGAPVGPARPAQAPAARSQAARPQATQAQPAQQQQAPPVHPALAKIPEDKINQKAVEIIQKAGGTANPIDMEDVAKGRTPAEIKKLLIVGQIYIRGNDAFVWDGTKFLGLENS